MPKQFWPTTTAVLALTLTFLIGRVQATGAPVQTPLTYGGTVADLNGKPYATAVEVTVAFYDAATAGTLKCKAPTVQSEPGTGRFAVTLPAECADAVHDKTDLWSEAAVGPGKTLLPRTHVGAVPYALESEGAKVAKGVQCVGCVNVGALLFDKDVDLAGHGLAAGKVTVAGAELTGASVKTLTQGGNADALHTHAALGGGGGGQGIKFKGITSVSFDGSKGVPTMNAQCAKDFGVARFCTTEMLEGLFPAVMPAAKSWVLQYAGSVSAQPSIFANSQGINATSNNEFANCKDGAGAYKSIKDYNNNLLHGMTVDSAGTYELGLCTTALPALCCGP